MSLETLTLGNVTFERHAYSAVFPLMAAEDYGLLLASMLESGQRVSIKLIDDRFVFDGWNRLRACVELGIDPVFERISTDQDLQALTIALNLAHRHLTAGQKGLIAGQLATMANGGARPGAGRPEISRTDTFAGVPNNQSLILDSDCFGASGNPEGEHQDPKLDLDGHMHDLSDGANEARRAEPSTAPTRQTELPTAPGSTIKAAAERLGVSRATAAMGKRVAESGDETLLDAVKAGDLSFAAGYAIAKSPRDEHYDRVRRALANGKQWLRSHKEPREFADKVSKAVLKGDALPVALTDAQIASVFVRVADTIVVNTCATAHCIESHADHLNGSLRPRMVSALQRLTAAMEKVKVADADYADLREKKVCRTESA